MENLNYQVNPKENIYFILKVVFTILIYGLTYSLISKFDSSKWDASFNILVVYAILIALYVLFVNGIMVGYVKGNGVRINRDQFPDVYKTIEKQCELLNMDIPPVYIIQNGGVLNAFAARFVGRNYVVLYSEIFELTFEEAADELNFVIAHELGHIKRHHMIKRFWLWPSSIIPFLGASYSRACEYTCDNIGHAISPNGSKLGLLLLASGKKTYKNVNAREYLSSASYESGFWVWFAEKVSSHPNLPKRISNLE